MAQFILAYHGTPNFENPEDGPKFRELWMQWVKDLGDAAVVPGQPVGMSKTVGPQGVEDHGGSNPLSGYSIVEAQDIDAALEMAKRCPHTQFATIEVAELVSMG